MIDEKRVRYLLGHFLAERRKSLIKGQCRYDCVDDLTQDVLLRLWTDFSRTVDFRQEDFEEAAKLVPFASLYVYLRRFQQIYGLEADDVFASLRGFGFEFDNEIIQAFKKGIEEERDNLLRCVFREQSKRKGKVKALLPPLQLIPKSLHPAESVIH